MNADLNLVIGLSTLFLGLFVLLNLPKVARFLQIGYDQAKNKYDTRASSAKGMNKLWTFLIFKPRTYYMNENEMKNVLLLISLLLIIWGIAIILLSFGVIK